MPVKLESVVPWGRSFDEYARMFALSETDLERAILDVGAGPSSFNAEMKSRGHRVISVDPIYELSAGQIAQRVEAVRGDMIRQVKEQPQQFVWGYVKSPEHLEELRIGAARKFLEDFGSKDARKRYRVGSLPKLGFRDGEFELALCSHFLFLYSDRLDEAFHVEGVREMLRVAKQVRIFPVTDLSGKMSQHLQAVNREFDCEVVKVEYEFLRGANQFLRIRR